MKHFNNDLITSQSIYNNKLYWFPAASAWDDPKTPSSTSLQTFKATWKQKASIWEALQRRDAHNAVHQSCIEDILTEMFSVMVGALFDIF